MLDTWYGGHTSRYSVWPSHQKISIARVDWNSCDRNPTFGVNDHLKLVGNPCHRDRWRSHSAVCLAVVARLPNKDDDGAAQHAAQGDEEPQRELEALLRDSKQGQCRFLVRVHIF